jgi:hypothetical protein
MFSFDRRGEDVVMYQYDTPERCELLKSFGFTPGKGSFSDICVLDELGVTGFNFGTGYYDEHNPMSYMVESRLLRQLDRFVPFFFANRDVKLAHEKKTYPIVSTFSYPDYSVRHPAAYFSPKYETIPEKDKKLTCYYCGEALAGDEEDVCEMCAKAEALIEGRDMSETEICENCGVPLYVGESKYCAECKKECRNFFPPRSNITGIPCCDCGIPLTVEEAAVGRLCDDCSGWSDRR